MSKKLYKIEFTNPNIDNCFVIADDPTEAYNKAVRPHDCDVTELKSITLLAESENDSYTLASLYL